MKFIKKEKINFKAEINKIIEKIRLEYKPEKIYVFGSAAQGKINKESDLDLFIIKNTRKSSRKRRQEVSRLLSDRKVPVDILVYTPKEARERQEAGDFFVEDILVNGKLVYAKKQKAISRDLVSASRK
jgi:predicted nucleotidyltransferase